MVVNILTVYENGGFREVRKIFDYSKNPAMDREEDFQVTLFFDEKLDQYNLIDKYTRLNNCYLSMMWNVTLVETNAPDDGEDYDLLLINFDTTNMKAHKIQCAYMSPKEIVFNPEIDVKINIDF